MRETESSEALRAGDGKTSGKRERNREREGEGAREREPVSSPAQVGSGRGMAGAAGQGRAREGRERQGKEEVRAERGRGKKVKRGSESGFRVERLKRTISDRLWRSQMTLLRPRATSGRLLSSCAKASFSSSEFYFNKS